MKRLPPHSNYGADSKNSKQPDYLAKLKRNDKNLTKLDLSGNGLSNVDVANIANALQYNINLTELDLSNNGINDLGITRIVELLKYNTSLTKLKLGNNKICNYGAKSIIYALKFNETLTTLDLSNNQIGDEGAMSIPGSILPGSALEEIGLDGNKISPGMIEDINNQISKNQISKNQTSKTKNYSRSFRQSDNNEVTPYTKKKGRSIMSPIMLPGPANSQEAPANLSEKTNIFSNFKFIINELFASNSEKSVGRSLFDPSRDQVYIPNPTPGSELFPHLHINPATSTAKTPEPTAPNSSKTQVITKRVGEGLNLISRCTIS